MQIHSAIFSDESNVSIGEEENGITSLNGYLDEYRISKGIARWTNDFIPPSYPYDTATSISLDKTSLDVNVGETNTLNALIVPNDITNKAVIWVSSDPSIATVDKDGKVTAIKKGTATITATTQDGSNLSASCTVNVKDSATISLNKSTDSINIGGIDNLVATVNSSDVGVTWTSSDNSIVTVDKDGKITGIKAGQATITATTADGKTVACVVTVNSSDKAVLSITMTNGQTKQYNVNMDIVNNFISWNKARVAGIGDPFFEFDITESSNPDIIKTDYVEFDKISSFEVDDYKNK
ncbi:Ig domain-containing protein [Clostridium felsineum]|nr:Ig domain-containing protein [Clostridium felsineum]